MLVRAFAEETLQQDGLQGIDRRVSWTFKDRAELEGPAFST